MEEKKEEQMGYLKHRNDGRLELRINSLDNYGNKKRKSFYGATEDECYHKAQDFLKMNEKRIKGIDVDATVVDIVIDICEDRLSAGLTKEQGYSRNMSTIEIIKKNYIGRVPIRTLTENDINQFRYNLSDNYSNSVIKKAYRLLKRGFEKALDLNIIEKDLTKNLPRPISKKPDKKIQGLSEDNQNKLVKYLENDYIAQKDRNNYAPQMLISLFTGLRMGEVNALKITDIDFKNNRININATIARGKDYRVFYKEVPKTAAGDRDIPLFEVVRDVLFEAVERAKKAHNPHGLLFYDKKAKKYITTQQVCNAYERICKKADIPYQGSHALRHTFATRKIEDGVSPKTLQKWMGHSSITITYDTYGDVFERHEEREAELGNNRYRGHYLKENLGSNRGSTAKVRPIKKRRKR